MLLLTSHFILRFKEEPKGFRIQRVKWIRLFDDDFQSRPFVGGISSIIFLSSFLDCRGCVEDGYLRGLWAQHLSIFCLALTRHDHGNTSELGFTTKVKGVPDKRQRNSDSDLRKKTWKVLQSNESILVLEPPTTALYLNWTSQYPRMVVSLYQQITQEMEGYLPSSVSVSTGSLTMITRGIIWILLNRLNSLLPTNTGIHCHCL